MKHSLFNNVAKLRFFLETTKEKGENLKQAAIFDDTRKNDICLPMVFVTSGRQMRCLCLLVLRE